MENKSCDLWPMVNGEPSKLYEELLEKINNRQITNYIYAAYLQSGVAAQMDAQGYVANSQGQHTAEDVYKFFNVLDLISKFSLNNTSFSKSVGAMNSLGDLIDFTNAEDAYNIAQQVNTSNSGKVAYVIQNGDKFNIIIEGRDSRTQIKVGEVEQQLHIWNYLKTELANANIDINDFMSFANDVVNPLKVDDFLRYVESLKHVKNNDMSIKDIQMTLALGKHIPQVAQVLTRMGGDIITTSQNVYNALQNPTSIASGLASLVNNALNLAKTNNIDVKAIEHYINANIIPNFNATNESFSIQKTLKDLNDKYHIDANVIVRSTNEIKTLTEAISDAILTLQRQIRNLEDTKGKTAQGQQLENTLQQLMKELESKQYSFGLLDFLSQANKYAATLNNMISSIPTTGTKLEYAKARAGVLAKLKTFRDGYALIVNSLANINSLTIDTSISDADKATIQTQASALKTILEKQDKVIRDISRDIMLDMATEFLGDSTVNGVPIANLIDMAENDLSIFDTFYAMGRISNPLVGTIGAVIREAQDSRDKKLNDISFRIREATDKLYKAGYSSDFMFDSADNVHIISDIDWKTYNKEKSKAAAHFKKQKLKGFAFKDAMEHWIESNTEERVVDIKTGRTERVPIFQDPTVAIYDNTTATLTFVDGSLSPAQQEYYNTMMQIKGELGSILPARAQKHYLPAQVRKSKIDVLNAARKNQISAKKAASLIADKVFGFMKIREDDAEYARNGVIIDGEEYTSALSDFDGTPLKDIPIFYISRIKDQSDLLLDFSAGLQELASTAINYEAMSDIKDVVEAMGDYVNELPISASKGKQALLDMISDSETAVVRKLVKKAESTNTKDVINGFIDQHIYGEKLKDGTSTTDRLLRILIQYTSWTGLALNVPGAIANTLAGEVQMLIEAGAGEYYNIGDYLWAHKTIFGDKTIRGKGELMDFLTNNVNSKSLLLSEMFDPMQENYETKAGKRYYQSTFRKLFGDFNSMALYGVGETLIHYVNMYAVLHNQKVMDTNTNKEISLYDALEVKKVGNANSKLEIKSGVVQLNGQVIDENFLNDIRKKVRNVNQNTLGSMNTEDKGVIHRTMIGRAVMNFRQWMVEHYSRRYRGIHYDASAGQLDQTDFYNKNKVVINGKKVRLYDAFDKRDNGLGDGSFTLVLKPNVYTTSGQPVTEAYINDLAKKQNIEIQWREGYWTTVGKFIKSYISDYLSFVSDANAHWDELTTVQKYNIKRVLSEIMIFSSLLGLSFALGDPSEHKGKWWRRLWICQTKRMIFEEFASSPIGMIPEAKKIIQSPIAFVNTISGILYPIYGIGDIGDTIKSGRYKGWNKYGRNVLKYSVPFYNQLDQLVHMDSEDAMYSVFNIGPSN